MLLGSGNSPGRNHPRHLSLIEALNNKEGFVTCYWSENKDDELEIKELTSATIRCYPINNEETKQSINDKKDGKFAIFSKAY